MEVQDEERNRQIAVEQGRSSFEYYLNAADPETLRQVIDKLSPEALAKLQAAMENKE